MSPSRTKNEPYSRGHNRVCRRIFYLHGVELAAADEEPAGDDRQDGAPVFSLRAVAGMPICNSMQVRASLGATTLIALLDTGSTHNFIAEDAARRTGLPIQPRPRLTATVANGERVTCPGVIRRAPVIIEGETFSIDLFVMPLEGYDLVLGTQWMVTLGRVVWDFVDRSVSFLNQGRQVSWSDVADHRPPLLAATTTPNALLEELLHSFEGVFAEPAGLPPQRAWDHAIVLKPGSTPVAVRPYRYPVAHKDELERQCAAMLDQGIVRRSDSAFSSPVLLVKKQDGAWRFCVDYRALNALTVKDAFPIPVVDELLDELHGAQFFTKLDLRSGYHQVRMRPADVHKTAFRTHDGFYEFLVMPFGLCNAPATFQALMNDVLRPFLRRTTWADHLRHIRAVLDELHRHILFVKRSKCIFGSPSVAYLGHIISAQGVAMDPAKVQAIHDWPAPRSARAVRGFLGLAGYYRKFNAEAQAAFQALKAAVTSAPVLALPDFTKGFIVECDASTHGFGAVLLQEHHPIAYFHRPPPGHIIGTCGDARSSLKFLLDQRLSTIPQHHWVGKLLGFDFSVEYKPGATNTVADALSRRDTNEEGSVLALSAPRFDFVDRLRQAQRQEPALVAIRDELAAGTRGAPWSLLDGMVAYADRLYIPPDSPLLFEVVAATHDDGHEGVQRTLHRLRRDFFFPAMRRVVQDFVRACATCQRNKSEHLHPAGLLLPLPVPQAVWSDVGLDFIEALPRVGGKSVLLTVVDRFSKYCHFIPLAHPYSAESVAQAFFSEIVRLRGIPQSMVSDRDSVFTSSFWRELIAAHDSDGQTEAANKVIVMYLRCFTGDRPRQWLRWLPWAEYVYNTAYQSSFKDTPFKVVYGRDPPSIRSYEPGETRVAAVAKTMAEREELLADVRYRLEQAQAVQKKFYDRLHRPVSYAVGDWVLLRLRQRAASSLPQAPKGKLKPRFVGPYQVTECINPVAVRLALPPRAKLHDVFHVGLLKKFIGTPPATPPPLPPTHHGAVTPEPEQAVRYRLARGVQQVLIRWKGQSNADATWEDVADFRGKFPHFQLEDELVVEEGEMSCTGAPT
ncbi:hypothetical protein U9M48_009373 [Paspalum notatum var. saurae]|uniref:Reverse transcriptase n=1 Tax=Paspalum notatum var. saurae TaxID=547442 RepID=A0AAQ3WF12_PASNO